MEGLVRVSLSFQQMKELDGGQRQEAEHQVAHHLGGAAHANKSSSVVVLQIGVDAFGGAALGEPTLFGGIELTGVLTAAGIGIDEGYMPKIAREPVNFRGVIGGVEQVVEALRNARAGHLEQRDCHLGVMSRGRGEDGADGDVPIDTGQVQFVADPRFLMSLAVSLAADIADIRQSGEILGQGAQRLHFQSPGFFWSGGRVAPGTSAPGLGLRRGRRLWPTPDGTRVCVQSASRRMARSNGTS